MELIILSLLASFALLAVELYEYLTAAPLLRPAYAAMPASGELDGVAVASAVPRVEATYDRAA